LQWKFKLTKLNNKYDVRLLTFSSTPLIPLSGKDQKMNKNRQKEPTGSLLKASIAKGFQYRFSNELDFLIHSVKKEQVKFYKWTRMAKGGTI
jgi:hypothetical protein